MYFTNIGDLKGAQEGRRLKVNKAVFSVIRFLLTKSSHQDVLARGLQGAS